MNLSKEEFRNYMNKSFKLNFKNSISSRFNKIYENESIHRDIVKLEEIKQNIISKIEDK